MTLNITNLSNWVLHLSMRTLVMVDLRVFQMTLNITNLINWVLHLSMRTLVMMDLRDVSNDAKYSGVILANDYRSIALYYNLYCDGLDF